MKEGREITQYTECSRRNPPTSDIFILQSQNQRSRVYHTITSNFLESVNNSGQLVTVLPRFRKGKSPLIAAFGVQHQKTENQQPKQKMIDKFFSRVEEKKSGEILVPKPKNSFCFVCKVNFDDYLKHIESKIHKENVSQCEVSKELRKLSNININFSSRRPKLSDYENEGLDLANSKPAKKRAIEETPSLVQNGSLF